MKLNPLLESITKRVFDQTAVTMTEIMESRQLSRDAVREIRDMNIASGAWEEVWKRVGKKVVRAYRLKSKR